METRKKIISINTSLHDLFYYYLKFTKPLHNLRPKEISLLNEILYKNEIEKPNFKRNEDRWKKVFDYDSKLQYKEILKIEDYTLQNLLSSLRKKKVIVDNQISKYYIPQLDDDTNNFVLNFNFVLDGKS